MSTTQLVAFIPARGGSKGIPRKNLVQLDARPLIVHTIEAAQQSGAFSRVIVSTDDSDIAMLAKSHGCAVHDRPAHLCTDSSRVAEAVLDAASTLQIADNDVVVVLQPTSPLRRADHIVSAVSMRGKSASSSVVSVVECDHHPLKSVVIEDGVLQPAFERHFLESSRQDLPRMYRPNGAIYVTPLAAIRQLNALVAPGALAFEMSVDDSIDIDTMVDIEHAEAVLRHRSR